MKRQKSKWDEHLHVFTSLTYEEKLNYWIEHKFNKMHHCSFDAQVAIITFPDKKLELEQKSGIFSIIPSNEAEKHLFIGYIINNLDHFSSKGIEYEIVGLKQIVETFESRKELADDIVSLINSELELLDLIIENSYQAKDGRIVKNGFEDALTGKIVEKFNLENYFTLDILYFYGATLSRYRKYLRTVKSNIEEGQKAEKKYSALDLTMRAILIKIMQDCDLFPQQTGTILYEFLSQLLNESVSSIKGGIEKVPNLFKGNMTKSQVEQFHPKLQKLRIHLYNLGDVKLINKYEEILARTEKIKQELKK